MAAAVAGASSWGVSLESCRPDGRTGFLQLRPPQCEFGLIGGASGSARFKMGLTSVVAAVQGPRESSRPGPPGVGSLLVVVRPLATARGAAERSIEGTLVALFQKIIMLDQLIQTTTTLILQVEADDGGLFSCCVNAAMCALLDSGIPCTTTCLGVSLVVPFNSRPLLDPLTEEALDRAKVDVSTYVCYVTDIHSGALCSAVPELPTPSSKTQRVHAAGLVSRLGEAAVESNSRPDKKNAIDHWQSAVETLDTVGIAVTILAKSLEASIRQHLEYRIKNTFQANNFYDD